MRRDPAQQARGLRHRDHDQPGAPAGASSERAGGRGLSHIPQPMASKILKTLARAGLLTSHRGAKGGYGLARPADAISVADVIAALDGPIALTACIEDGPRWLRDRGAVPGADQLAPIDDDNSPRAGRDQHGGDGADDPAGLRPAPGRAAPRAARQAVWHRLSHGARRRFTDTNRPRRPRSEGQVPAATGGTGEGDRWRQPSRRSAITPATSTSTASSPTSKPDTRPTGLNEDVVRFISAKKERAGVAARVAAEGLSPLADDDRADLGQGPLPADRLPGDLLLLGAQERRRRPEEPGRGRSRSCCETYEKLGIPLHEQEMLAGVAVDAVFDSVSVATTFKEKLAEAGVIFCSISEAVQQASRAGAASTSARWCPTRDNFFAALNSAVFTDGSFVYVPEGRALPDGAVAPTSASTRPNTGQFERTLIIADEGAYVSYLEGCTAPHARREPAARRGGRAGRPRRRRDQVLDGAELVPGRRGGQGRHLQLRHQARRLPRRAARRSPGPRSRPARRSPGSTRAASCRATTRSASSTRSP